MGNIKLGIGVITTPRRTLREEDLKVDSRTTQVHIHTDKEFRGPAYARNQCIKTLYEAGCDYIALCDDDLIYNKVGWLDATARVMAEEGLAYTCLPHVLEGVREDVSLDVERWSAYIGAFYVIARKVVEEVGYLSGAFEGYGFEDTHYKHRLRAKYGPTMNPKGLPYLVMSMDVLHMNPTPSIEDKAPHIARNGPICEKEIANGIIYYPYPGS